MRYIPNTPGERKVMLETIGIDSVEELFKSIPSSSRLNRALALPSQLSEGELYRYINKLSKENSSAENNQIFFGAGSYQHYIPAAVGHLISRSEFYTSYTPYQPEISQGTLQAIFEFQTLITQLTGMEIGNASMYDGATALAEAALMAKRINSRSEIIVSRALHPNYFKVLQTYTKNLGIKIREVPLSQDGSTDINWIKNNLSEKTAAVIMQSPNFFGIIEHLKSIKEHTLKYNSLFIVSVVEPLSLGLLVPPGECGADIVTGEGQSFGIPTSFGGPYLGFFATNKKYLRSMPGRLVGETVDRQGRRGYVLTLATREQHIRRNKATSNICSNEALCALSATIYLSLLGKVGLKKLARLNLLRSEYAKKKISGLKGFKLKFNGPAFNEFVIESKIDPGQLNMILAKKGIIGGLPLKEFYPELNNTLLFCVTECNSREDIDRLCAALNDL